MTAAEMVQSVNRIMRAGFSPVIHTGGHRQYYRIDHIDLSIGLDSPALRISAADGSWSLSVDTYGRGWKFTERHGDPTEDLIWLRLRV